MFLLLATGPCVPNRVSRIAFNCLSLVLAFPTQNLLTAYTLASWNVITLFTQNLTLSQCIRFRFSTREKKNHQHGHNIMTRNAISFHWKALQLFGKHLLYAVKALPILASQLSPAWHAFAWIRAWPTYSQLSTQSTRSLSQPALEMTLAGRIPVKPVPL